MRRGERKGEEEVYRKWNIERNGRGRKRKKGGKERR